MKIIAKKVRARLFTAFLFSFISFSAFAEVQVNIDGLLFKVDNVTYGQWSKPRHHLVNELVEKADKGNDILSYVAISYTITNNNDQKKLDLDGKFLYSLFDNFGNRYRAMRKPDDYRSSVLTVSKNFPSIYPGEVYGETLFFEAPVSMAKSLHLSISAEGLILSQPVDLAIPLVVKSEKLPLEEAIKKDLDTKSIGAAISQDGADIAGVKILSPLPGIILDQGQVTRVQVASSGNAPPKRIIVIAMDNTFLDDAPDTRNIYDINVPLDQSPGAYMINVIAEWADGNISSASTPFYVKGSKPLGIF